MRYLIFVLALYAFPAGACGPEDLAGTWRTFGIASGAELSTTTCKFTIGPNGFLSPGTICKFSVAKGLNGKDTVTGGRLRVAENCRVKGSILFAGGRSRIEAQIGNQVMSGRAKGGQTVSVFTGIKLF